MHGTLPTSLYMLDSADAPKHSHRDAAASLGLCLICVTYFIKQNLSRKTITITGDLLSPTQL